MLRSWRATEWLRSAALLTVLGLGLPVGSWEVDGYSIPGWYAPGYCTTTYDYDGWASLECTAGTFSPGMYLPGSEGSLIAAQSGIRVFVAVAVLLVVVAVRRRWSAAANAALLVGAVGIVRYAVPPHPGIVVFAFALVALCVALHRLGLVRLPAAFTRYLRVPG